MTGEGDELSDRWCRVLEYGFFLLWVLTIAAGGIFSYVSMTSTAASGFGTINTSVFPEPIASISGWLLIALPLYGVLYHMIAAVGLYADASKLHAAELDWYPFPILYAAGGLALSALVVLPYLRKRYEYLPPDSSSRLWFPIVMFCVSGGFLALVGFGIGGLDVTAPLVLLGLGPPLALAVYHDAKRVNARTDWQPNPITYFMSVLFTTVLLVGPYLIGGLYIYKRRQVA
ncbi:putative membrane protein [Halorhabdus sp. SVX81]|uniref:hypothetical protein n=1 Tax=Halorhabdus sp. SVX81 TaxID=2978283 RepID=UPI0023D97B46|nr:hypothetical protein [Halorhabdus sp. SVX81]WEL16930.1 putative membrane protein [Halorhabdus sp. SVX81]